MITLMDVCEDVDKERRWISLEGILLKIGMNNININLRSQMEYQIWHPLYQKKE